MARPGFFRLKLLAACLVLAAAAILGRSLWLPVLGYALVHDDGPAKADIAVVLAGDYEGHRIEKAAGLIREGYVPAALISGPPGFYGGHESDYAIPMPYARASRRNGSLRCRIRRSARGRKPASCWPSCGAETCGVSCWSRATTTAPERGAFSWPPRAPWGAVRPCAR